MAGIGVAVVGASARSTMLFDYLKRHPDAGSVTGAYDPVPRRCGFLIDHYEVPGARVYDSLEAAVGDDRAQAVFVAPWDAAHAECSLAALRAGKHVFCEKPLATTLADCDAVVAAAAEAPGTFYLGMNLRHSPVHETVHDLVAAGRAGRLTTIEAGEHYGGGRTYFRRWNRLRKYGGGLWITKACHDFDVLNWLAGAAPARVFACSSLSHYRPRADAADYCRDCALAATCPDAYARDGPGAVWRELWDGMEAVTGERRDLCLWNSEKDTFDNGIAVVDYANDVRATYTVNVLSGRDTRELTVVGTEGTIRADMAAGAVTFHPRHGGPAETLDVTERMRSGHGGADAGIMADFFDGLRTGRAPRSGPAEGRASVRVGLAARESCDTGRVVELT